MAIGSGLSYLVGFQCIGASCVDNCCVGWDVDFDKDSYVKYGSIKDEGLARLIREKVFVKENCFDAAIDYAGVLLKKNKRCPFLDPSNWCRIQSTYGESYLSNVCATFPRYFNRVDGIIEQSATLSCPEIARLALLEGQELESVEMDYDPQRHFLTYEVSTSAYDSQKLMKLPLKTARLLSIAALRDRRYAINRRLAEVAKVIGADRILGENKSFETMGDKVRALQSKLLRALNPGDQTLSKRYLEFGAEMVDGLGLSAATRWRIDEKRYREGKVLYFEPFQATHGHLVENYFINFFYKNIFPFSPYYSPQEMMALVMSLYLMIELQLVGLGLKRGCLTPERVCDFLSAFSKAVEHHNTFMDEAIILFKL